MSLSSVQSRSTTKAYDLAVFIGRLQGLHNGHLGAVRQGLEQAERVLVLIGSANLARDTRNPFTYEERSRVLVEALEECGLPLDRIDIRPLNDSAYDSPGWINHVSTAARLSTKALRPRICLIGNIRDATSEYLTWFRAWDYVPIPDTGINATAAREALFAGNDFSTSLWSNFVVEWHLTLPAATLKFFRAFRETPEYAYLKNQREAELIYRARWGTGPFQTVDPVIVSGDHVLLVERGGTEGTGSVGLPGGFLNLLERLLDGACREGIEETALFIRLEDRERFMAYLKALKANPDLPTPDFVKEAQAKLRACLRGRGERFDDPRRSRRGHLITEAFLFVLPTDGHGLPPVLGCDDASRAFWMPISEVRPDNTFEDHAFIIDKMLSLHG
jgi:bifunctional NMN adenylyltransferase/nudix hydrolase